MKTIAICACKGGVGKTTTSIATAVALKEKGKKVLVIDVDDSNAGLTKALGYDPCNISPTLTDLLLTLYLKRDIKNMLPEAIKKNDEGIDIIPCDNELAGMVNVLASQNDERKNLLLKNIINEVKGNYDYIILDTAPALNVLTLNVLAAADETVIVTQAQKASEDAIGKFISTVEAIKKTCNPDLIIKGLLITIVDTRVPSEKTKSNAIGEIYSDLGMKVFNSRIPKGSDATKCVEVHQSVIRYNRNGNVSKAYMQFADEID